LRNLTAQEVMHPNTRTVTDSALAINTVEMMEKYRITSVLVTDAQGLLVGALNTNDLMRAKVI